MIREITRKDISTVNQWLIGWRMNKLPEEMYPDTGLIMLDDETGEEIYAGFVWCPSTSKLAQVGFITRNPFYRKRNKIEQTSLSFIRHLLLYTKQLGYDYVATWAENTHLVKDFKDLGFTEASNRVSELIAKIE